jgi:hypothetical protein
LLLRATFRVFKIERKMTGKEDLPFLERVFQKLLLNFTWYVNCIFSSDGLIPVDEGGSIGRIKAETTSLRADSSVLITLGFLIARSRYPQEELSVKPMEPHGWHSIVSICDYPFRCYLF